MGVGKASTALMGVGRANTAWMGVGGLVQL